jgi:1,2-diacylglycerol 3-alpha-glucosyltransferase
MNVFVQGMRRSGTTILYDAFLEDPGLRCFYEPFSLGKVTMGGGSGVREADLFSGARALREDLRRRRYPSIDAELFNWGGPRDPDRELETDLPEHCRDYLGCLLDSAPNVLIKEVRMYRKVPELAALDPDAAFVHVVRDPRAVVASHMLGREAKHQGRYPTADDFFEDRSKRGLWSSHRLSELLLEWPEYAHLAEDPPDFLRVLLVWKLTFEEARREGLRCFGDRYLLLRHEDFRSDPAGVLASVYRLLGRQMPDEVASFARRHVQPRQTIFAEDDPRWLEAFGRIGLEWALREGGYSELLASTVGGAPGDSVPSYATQPATRVHTAPQRGDGRMVRREEERRFTGQRGVEAGGSAPGERLRIGIVAWWFNRGQAVVARQLRSALTELGHETFVLARGTKGNLNLPSMTRISDVWDQSGVTPASGFDIPVQEYEEWASANGIEVAFFDQNYQFKEVAALRRRGIKTVGRFVWESFSARHVGPALKAYDVIYSVTRCEQERYRSLGIESPYVAWGCHPDLFGITPRRDPERVTFHYNAGVVSKRKPYQQVFEAFARVRDPDLRLLFKAQMERHRRDLIQAAERDPRIELVVADLPAVEHLQLFADSDVCLAPARWEGLGVHLFEAIAFGMPVITNDAPPMNELVEDGFNGLLVRSHQDGLAKSGIPAYLPDVEDMARAIERLADPELRERLSEGARQMAERRNWSRTVSDVGGLLERLGAKVVYRN